MTWFRDPPTTLVARLPRRGRIARRAAAYATEMREKIQSNLAARPALWAKLEAGTRREAGYHRRAGRAKYLEERLRMAQSFLPPVEAKRMLTWPHVRPGLYRDTSARESESEYAGLVEVHLTAVDRLHRRIAVVEAPADPEIRALLVAALEDVLDKVNRTRARRAGVRHA